MKILITADCYEPVINGLVTSTTTLRKNLLALGHDVRILTLSQTNKSENRMNIYYTKSANISFLYPNTRLSLHLDSKIMKELIAWGPDVIHSQNEISTLHMAKQIARKLSIPIVHTYHTLYEDYTHYFCPSKKVGKKIVASLSRNLLKKMQAVIAPSAKTEKILIGYRVRSPIYVIPTGIDLDKFSEPLPKKRREEIFKKHSIPTDKKILLTLGRVAKEKNIDELFRNIAQMDMKDYVCVVVGDGPHRADLEKLRDKLGLGDKIIFTGMVPYDEVPDYYKIGDVFISASTTETQGLTYFEAMASGLPLVCKSDDCLTYIVINDWNGYQCDTPDEFHKRLNEVLSDSQLYAKLSKNARLTAGKFSSREFAKKALLVYEAAIERYERTHTPSEDKRTWTTKKIKTLLKYKSTARW